MRVVTGEPDNRVMGSGVTLAAYIKADVRTVFLLCFFALDFFVALAVFAVELDFGNNIDPKIVIFVAILSVPLVLFAVVLLDALLMVRRINRAIEEGRFQWGVISKMAIMDSSIRILKIVLDREGAGVRRAFVFSGLRTRSIKTGSKVAIAEPSLSLFQNSIPLQLLLDNSALARLIGEADASKVGESELLTRPHRAKSGFF